MVVQLFLHQDLERLGINSVGANESYWNELVPKATRDRLKRPVLAYKYAPPISRSFCNYGQLSSISLTGCEKILNSPCQCKNPSFRPYVDAHTEHVITTDTSIMRNATLQSLMAKGTKYHCTVHPNDNIKGDNTREMVQHDLHRAFEAWRRNIETNFGTSDMGATMDWNQFVLAKAEELVMSSDMLNSTPPTHNPPSKEDQKQLSFIHRHFVITTVDKAENNFCIICKKLYLQECLKELQQGVAYVPTDRTERDILISGSKFTTHFNRDITETRDNTTPVDDETVNTGDTKIPNFHIRVKLHKEPLGYRFVAGSKDAPLTSVSQWLTSALKALIPEVHRMWKNVAQRIPDATPDLNSWIISDSEEVSRLCRATNRSRMNRQPMPLATYDSTSVYTTLSQDDMKTRLASLITSIFDHKRETSRACILMVDKYGHHEWCNNPRKGLHGIKMQFTKEAIIEAISSLVDNTYVKFAGRLWHQIVGIPMGTNCAGFLANLYCFTYELDYLVRVVDDNNFEMARELLRTKRYIDDLVTLDCNLLPRHLYLPDGIYPREILSLVAAAQGETVPYMDLLIRQNRRRGLITSIYDKRLEAKYANINVIRYPDTQSVMATKAKYGIVTSQLYRFLRRCTLATDFVYNISLVLHRLLNKGYHTKLLWAQVRHFMLRHPHIYAGKSVRTWCNRIRAKIDHLSLGHCKPGPLGQIMTDP